MTGIKEFFQGLVADGVVSQEPVNYDAAQKQAERELAEEKKDD